MDEGQPAPLGTVRMLLTAETAGAPMRSHDRVQVLAGVGIAGDRYATKRGYWSDPRWPDQELTLVAEEAALALGLLPEQLRRNIVTAGVDLNALIGRTFRFGLHGPTVLGVRRCEPCAYIEGFAGKGTMAALYESRGGGLRARVLTDGWIAVGEVLWLAGAAAPTHPSDSRA